jgi:DNA-binding MarR family transcriptional regulator
VTRDELIAQIMASQRRFQQSLARDRTNPFLSVNLTMSQLKILFALRLNGGSGVQDLAHLMGVSPATMTGIVDRLVAAGYVTRREDPHDRRVRRIELSPGGDELLNGIVSAGEEHQLRLMSRLSLGELTVVAQAMELIGRAIERDEAERAGG